MTGFKTCYVLPEDGTPVQNMSEMMMMMMMMMIIIIIIIIMFMKD
jgi:hypothetical protein